MSRARLAGSFRDPSGFMFTHETLLYRQVNLAYRGEYDHFIASGLKDDLVGRGYLVDFEEVDPARFPDSRVHKILKPSRIPFVSYPYEWSFSQLRTAALLTLRIQRRALEYGMSLKDSSAYNIQFIGSQPVLIDTLSFERCDWHRPWVAYRQFCQHFLAPLALMAYCDVRLAQLLRSHIDGIPLDLASRLLSRRTWLSLPLAMHIHLHARAQRRYSKGDKGAHAARRTTKRAQLGILESLASAVASLRWTPRGTEWSDYYADTNYSDSAMSEKERVVAEILADLAPATAWDLGANTGRFSRLASAVGASTVAFDIDPAAVEKNFRECVAAKDRMLLPLIMDVTNPSPSLGWKNEERSSLSERGPADVILALALIHHIAISNNVPLLDIAEWFSQLGRHAIVEWVPKSDSQVQRLLASRADIFDDYSQAAFELAFGRYFEIRRRTAIGNTERTIYHLARR